VAAGEVHPQPHRNLEKVFKYKVKIKYEKF
jgi:hypothetical protein